MRPKPTLLLPSPGERLGGWIYLPIYLVLLPVITALIALICSVVGHGFAVGQGFEVDGALLVHCEVAMDAVHALVLAIVFRRYLARSARQVRQFPGRYLAAVGLGFAFIYVGSLLMEWLTTALSPSLENLNDANIEQMLVLSPWEMVAFTVLFAPFTEELLFRGLIFTSLRARSRALAYAVTVLVFSAIHVLGYALAVTPLNLVLCLLQYLPASFALAWALEYSGSIWAGITIHMLNNAVATAAMLLSR